MAKIKITEEQAKMLKEMGKTKVLKITQEQYNRILEMENSISEKNLSPMGNEMVKQADPIDRPQMSSDLKNNLPEMYEKFINELYGISESTEKVYEKLHKLMEGAGLINNGKLVKEKFDGDKERVKQVINAGLYEMACGGSAYRAMEAIEEALERKDITGDYFRKQIGEPKKSGKSQEELMAAIEKKRKEANAITTQRDKEREEALDALAKRENDDRIEEEDVNSGGIVGIDILNYEPFSSLPETRQDVDYSNQPKVYVPSLNNSGEHINLLSKDDLTGYEVTDPKTGKTFKYPGYLANFKSVFGSEPEFELNPDAPWYAKTVILNPEFQEWKEKSTRAKASFLDKSRELGHSTDEATTATSSGAFVPPLGSDPRFKSNVPEEIDEQGIGSVGAYDTPGFASSEFMGTKGKKGKAPVNKGITHKKTMRPDYKFVTIKDKCNEFPYCDQGPDAISINESLYEEIAKKTNRTVEDVKKIINNKNK